MAVMLLCSFGFVLTTLEIHLSDYGISNILISLCFILQTFTYAFFSFFGFYLFTRIDKRSCMSIGITLMGLAYLMLAPCEFLFPNELGIVLASLPLMGLGQAMVFSKN
jgi:MFS family permease